MSAIVPGLSVSVLQDASKGIVSYVAGSSISALCGIKLVAGVPAYCDADVVTDIGKLVGVSTNAVISGDALAIQYDGILSDAGWAWVEGPVYLGSAGQLTQSAAGLTFVQSIGEAVSATSIMLNIKLPIRRL